MKASELNVTIREMFHQLINDNYKKHPICAATLGQHASPQFEKFLKGSDLGVKPMERLVDGLGFDLLLVPVRNEDKATMKVVETACSNFITDARKDLIEYLEERQNAPRASTGSGSVAKAFKEAALKMINEL